MSFDPSTNPPTTPARLPASRHVAIAGGVVAFHVLALWALQSGLLMRAAEMVVPAEILTRFLDAPAPRVQPQPPAPPTQPVAVKKAVAKAPVRPEPQPLAITDPTPSPSVPAGAAKPQLSTATVALPTAETPTAPVAPSAPAAPPAVQLPSSDADYLQNPKPPYPPLSRRLNEQGKTVVRVFIGVDGLPQRSEIARSSGYERLDQAAITTVMRWRFVPGKRGGMAEAMWFNIPINWVLE